MEIVCSNGPSTVELICYMASQLIRQIITLLVGYVGYVIDLLNS